jgi:hypothetical protein
MQARYLIEYSLFLEKFMYTKYILCIYSKIL